MADLKSNLSLLAEACQNPRARLDFYLSQGKKVVGCFPAYTPEELVHASGMIPMGLWGGRTELMRTKSYLPAFACPIMQSNMEFGLSGAYQGLSAVIIPASAFPAFRWLPSSILRTASLRPAWTISSASMRVY